MRIFNKKKPCPFPLTDEEFIRETLKAADIYAKEHPDDTFDINDCVDRVLSCVEPMWRNARLLAALTEYSPLGEKELRELEDRVRPELRARAYKKAMEYLKNRKARQINRATTEAVITYELQQRGCEFFFHFQTHRVKVYLRVGENHAMAFYVRFRDIREGRLTAILDAAALIAKQIGLSGLDINLSSGWKDYAGWKK